MQAGVRIASKEATSRASGLPLALPDQKLQNGGMTENDHRDIAMPAAKSIPAKVQGGSPSASVPDSLFDSYCYRGQQTPRTQRFKRVGEPSLPILETEPDNGRRVGRGQRSRSARLRAKSNPQPQPQPRMNASPLSDTCFGNMKILPQDFFQIDALDLAPRLLGKFLRRDDVVLQITEVEAYRPNDSACHGRFGITARTAPVFGPGGHAYVYLCYGLHVMLNVVADKEGAGAAVLIRSCAPISGLDVIQQRRGQKTEKPILLTGPGKVGQALGLSTEWSNHSLYRPGGVEVLDGPKPESILVGPRVGIEYASQEHVSALWRFAIAGTPWISAPKNTLRPPS